jgi:PleD family two-component response regulator
MQKHGRKKILAVVEDLLFTVKISDAAKRAGLDVEFVKSERDVIDKATHEKPLLVILDLNFSAVEPLKLISKLKSDGEMKQISVIGYLSHVQGELKQQAQDAGANMVMARSAFSQNLPQILRRHSGVV